MRLLKDQQGIAHLAVFIVLAAAAIGFVGYVSWNAYQANKKLDTITLGGGKADTKKAETSDPYKNWKAYVSTQESTLSFRYPADWAVKNNASQKDIDPNSDGIELTSSAGSVLWWSSSVGGLGGYCDPDTEPHVFVDWVSKIDGASGLYAVQTRQTVNGTLSRDLGIVDGTKPVKGDTGECAYYNLFDSRADADRQMWLQTKTLKDQDVSDIRLVLLSLKYPE